MLQVARLAPKLLGDSAALVADFLKSQQVDGAFVDRSSAPDLYYTVFGFESLRALSSELPVESATEYLQSFACDGLDLVHLSSLVRCWANVARTPPPEFATAAHARLARFQSRNIYESFLLLGAFQDLRLEPPPEIPRVVEMLRATDGAYANHRGAARGLTSATAAAIGILRQFGESPSADLGHWLLARRHSSGGFFASPDAPLPDLLSTATALHALASLQVPLDSVREPALDFVDSLLTNRGGFFGSWADDVLDCEYTYYGLLALGHLSL
jgi:prenyltransferase beta subunit